VYKRQDITIASWFTGLESVNNALCANMTN
jgi:hypothetical protein